jgi:energy-coupling factor transporter transmembrane protein EcfT
VPKTWVVLTEADIAAANAVADSAPPGADRTGIAVSALLVIHVLMFAFAAVRDAMGKRIPWWTLIAAAVVAPVASFLAGVALEDIGMQAAFALMVLVVGLLARFHNKAYPVMLAIVALVSPAALLIPAWVTLVVFLVITAVIVVVKRMRWPAPAEALAVRKWPLATAIAITAILATRYSPTFAAGMPSFF